MMIYVYITGIGIIYKRMHSFRTRAFARNGKKKCFFSSLVIISQM